MTTAPTAGNPYDLADAVRAARLAAGLTQTELALDARVGRQWLVGFEAGDKASAPLDMVWRLLTALDLAVTLAPTPPPRARRPVPEFDLDEVIFGRTSKP